MCGLVAIHGDQLLSFACPKESNQRKDTLASAVTRASCPRDCASRLRGSPTVRPCTEVELAGILPAIAVATDSCTCSPRPRGAREERSAAVPAAEAMRSVAAYHDTVYRRRRIYAAHSKPVIPAKAGIHFAVALALGSPLSSGEGRTEKPRAPHAGGARDRADSAAGHGWPVSRTRSPAANRSLRRAARIRGCRFLWLLSFGQAKESNRRPWMADETHTDVSQS